MFGNCSSLSPGGLAEAERWRCLPGGTFTGGTGGPRTTLRGMHLGDERGAPGKEKREGARGGAGAAGVSGAWGRDAGNLCECVAASVLMRKSWKEQTTGLGLNWAQVVVGLSGSGCQEREFWEFKVQPEVSQRWLKERLAGQFHPERQSRVAGRGRVGQASGPGSS